VAHFNAASWSLGEAFSVPTVGPGRARLQSYFYEFEHEELIKFFDFSVSHCHDIYELFISLSYV
jgi:hypothetical protein